MLKKTSLAKDFKVFTAIILLSVFITSVCVGFIVHHSYISNEEQETIEKASLIDNELSEALLIVEHYAKFIGNKIINSSNKNELNQNFIKDLFYHQNFFSSENSYIWTKFSWITPNKKMLIFKDDTIFEKDISKRSYLDQSYQHPGKIFFSAPAIGELTNEWILPAGIGVANVRNQFLGTISVGFNLTKLTQKLESIFNKGSLFFIILDEKMNFILASSNTGLSFFETLPPRGILDQLENVIKGHQYEKGVFNQEVDFRQFRFNYFKHSSRYPFYIILGENIRVTNSQYWQIFVPRVIELSIMGLLFIILLYYFRQYIVNPIMLLVDSAQKIDSQKVSIDDYQDYYLEVRILANQLQEIQKTRSELLVEKSNVDIANKSLETKVKERTIELEKALAIKTEFLNNISHEVRTPIQGITSISKGLVEDWAVHNESKRYELAQLVAKNSQRLFSLVTNLLDITIFNEDKLYLHFQKSDFIELINEVIEESRTLYLKDKDINIIFDIHPKIAIIHADQERITQVLRNLLTNAIKFMNEGLIEIKVEPDLKNDQYIFAISDQGPGIPENELKSIFQPFSKGQNTKSKVSGVGLGLSISRKIIHGHKGQIWAVNNLEKGATFFFTIQKSKNNILESKVKSDIVRNNTTILMIDDESTCQMSMEILLSNSNFKLISKNGGIEGLKYLVENFQQIDLILLDLMMPDMYGLNVLNEIKSNPDLAHIPVIIQSGTNDTKEIERSFKMGAVAFIRKPYQRKQILETIERSLLS